MSTEPALRNEKYCFTGETKQWLGITLHRIRAVRDIAAFGIVAGALGGWIEKPENLSVSGDAWVYGNAQVYGDAWVSGNAQVYGNARVSGDARVYGNARVYARNHLGWFSCVGSENGTLCWFLEKDRTVRVNRGCFSGTLSEFQAAVDARHGDSEHGEQYRLLIQFIELRSAEALRDFAPAELVEA